MTIPKAPDHPTKIECTDCAKLPSLHNGSFIGDGVTYRPQALRKIDPRSLETHKTQPRCTTHWLAWRNGQRAKGAAARSRKRSGLDEETRQELLAFQGGVCAGCGRAGTSNTRKVLSADHDHELAREHGHSEDVACEDCMRGFLCSRDNRDILGLLYAQKGVTTDSVIKVLMNLAGYLMDPPMRRMMRSREVDDLDETA